MKLYDDWRDASSKGDQATKNEKLKDLRLLYKQSLYKTLQKKKSMDLV